VTPASLDKFLGGRLTIRQNVDGYRAGLDAVLLAAAVPAEMGDRILELGSGAGAASLCLAARVAAVSITGVEKNGAQVGLASENALLSGYSGRVSFVRADVFDMPEHLKRDFAHVFCNPPFHGEEGFAPPLAEKRAALRDEGRLGDWMETGFRRTASGGAFTAILRADRLREALERLPERGVAVFPLWPRAGEPAKRVIVQARKASRAAPALLAGLVLHAADGSLTPEAEAILRGGASLALDSGRL
jgi:tRNA1(Val) A37 N6-methylase TrmN6